MYIVLLVPDRLVHSSQVAFTLGHSGVSGPPAVIALQDAQPMSRPIVVVALILLSAALLSAAVWLISSPDFEPAITCLTLLAAMTGLVIDRWFAEREHRRRLLRALVHELYMNLSVLNELQQIGSTGDGVPQMLPRFYNATLLALTSSGLFATTRDEKLWKQLHTWMQRSSEANIRLSTTEMITLSRPETAPVFHEKLVRGRVMAVTRTALLDVTRLLLERYEKESGIEAGTVLFPSPDEPRVNCEQNT